MNELFLHTERAGARMSFSISVLSAWVYTVNLSLSHTLHHTIDDLKNL